MDRSRPEEELPRISVVTITHGRPQKLLRAIESVRDQDYSGEIEHVIIADDCFRTEAVLAHQASAHRGRKLVVQACRRPASDAGENGLPRLSVYRRLSRLFNVAARSITGPWIAFLDDDNRFERDHLRSLIDTALQTGALAVHSWRKVVHPDGSPYLEERFPWTVDPGEASKIYELLCSRGVWKRGTNELRGRAGPLLMSPFRVSTRVGPHDPVFLVDTSEWLIERKTLLAHPYPEFTEQHLAEGRCPDDNLLEQLLKASVPIVSTLRPTLIYELGGISN